MGTTSLKMEVSREEARSVCRPSQEAPWGGQALSHPPRACSAAAGEGRTGLRHKRIPE